MARLNGKEVDFSDLTDNEIGDLLRDATPNMSGRGLMCELSLKEGTAIQERTGTHPTYFLYVLLCDSIRRADMSADEVNMLGSTMVPSLTLVTH
jgi:hypothetical protein